MTPSFSMKDLELGNQISKMKKRRPVAELMKKKNKKQNSILNK
jgi:hypothetical protein